MASNFAVTTALTGPLCLGGAIRLAIASAVGSASHA
jgi:hypothetical protein